MVKCYKTFFQTKDFNENKISRVSNVKKKVTVSYYSQLNVYIII